MTSCIDAKPHIGTDKLCGVVKAMRMRILELGGEVRFGARLTKVLHKGGRVAAVRYEDAQGGHELPAEAVVLAIGHSARDTFESLLRGRRHAGAEALLHRRAHRASAKASSTVSQYGAAAGHPALGAADYKLALHLPSGRSVYTFCMCPGGTVVAAASEPESVVTNGMSCYARDGINANSALLVGVGPEDFGSEHPLAGMFLQREIERRAFVLGGRSGKAPLPNRRRSACGARKRSAGLRSSRAIGRASFPAIWPSFCPRRSSAPCARRFRCWVAACAGLTARTQCSPGRKHAPPRLCASPATKPSRASAFCGLYPCGEGAGYAGGITSAAVDGVSCAEAVLNTY